MVERKQKEVEEKTEGNTEESFIEKQEEPTEDLEEKTQDSKDKEEISENPQVDEKGVEWKNRALEYKRKLEALEQKINMTPVPEFDEEKYYEDLEMKTGVDKITLKIIDHRVQEKLTEIQRQEREADEIADLTIEELEEKYPHKKYALEKCKSAIKRKLKEKFSLKGRKNPILIEEVAFSVIGRIDTTPKNVRRQSTTVKSPVLSPSSGSGATTRASITLTDAEKRFAMEHELFENGLSDAEIRALYNRKHKK